MCSALAAAALISAVASGSGRTTGTSPARSFEVLLPPLPPPFIVRDLSRPDALATNAAIPFSSEVNVPARPFQFRGDDDVRNRALECLTLAVYYEAGNQDAEAQAAVAQVVLNRVRHPAFPASVCGVVFQGDERKTGCQFTFTCDGSLRRPPEAAMWSRAQQVAEAALDGAVFKPVGLATHYHADYVVPYWATSLDKSAQIGTHIFYRWPGGWGRPAAFARKYSGEEADPAELRALATTSAIWDKGAIAADETISFAVDPRLELLSVVQHLANGPSDPQSSDRQYESDIARYFAPQKDHLAVQLFTQLSHADPGFASRSAEILLGYSFPPNLVRMSGSDPSHVAPSEKRLFEFLNALRDFARVSEFQRFFTGHQPFYSRTIKLAQQRAGMARAYWQAYTKAPLNPAKLLLATLVMPPRLACTDAADPLPPFVPTATIASGSNADILLGVEAAQPPGLSGASARAKLDSISLDEQLTRTVFARVAALTTGEGPSSHLRLEATDPRIERTLREYEADHSPTANWRDFATRVSRATKEHSCRLAATQS